MNVVLSPHSILTIKGVVNILIKNSEKLQGKGRCSVTSAIEFCSIIEAHFLYLILPHHIISSVIIELSIVSIVDG